MVDTMDPVSIKQGTSTPPMETSKWGQDDIKLEIVPASVRTPEPIESPPKLWLCSSGGASFPPVHDGETAYHPLVEAEDRRGAIGTYTPWPNDLAADTSYILSVHWVDD